MSITEISILHHVAIVLLLLWTLSSFNCCHPVAYFASLIYLYLVHDRYVLRLRKTVQFEERRQGNQRRVLSDSETVRWLNYAVEKMWVICMEQIVSQKILLPIVPWFLEKYKPWTVKSAAVQHMYMGRSPPMFTDMRVLRQSTGDDHLVLELGMNFRTAEDMSAVLAVKLTKRLGFGILAKLHLTGMHIEGKVLVGVKFVRKWPFLGRVRLCFAEPPYFQMVVKPLVAHGFDVTELPGIAGWLDNLLGNAFEETLVEPNMLVVDVEKFASPESESWFFVDAKEPVAYVLVEVLEAADMKPSDLNGLADPYVKGQIGPYRFRTKIQRKTLSPKWHEEFKIPICTWESPNILTIEVRDKDHFIDDTLGDYSIFVGDLRGGQRHDMWLSLQNIKMGRLHLAITVLEGKAKVVGQEQFCDETSNINNEHERKSSATDASQKVSSFASTDDISQKVADKFEPIDIDGQKETGLWIHTPGTEVPQVWEPRKGKSRAGDNKNQLESNVSNGSFKKMGTLYEDNSNRVHRGLQKLNTIFHKRADDNSNNGIDEPLPLPSPYANIRSINSKKVGVKFIAEESVLSPHVRTLNVDKRSPNGNGPDSPSKAKVKEVKEVTKSILKNAGRGLKHALSKKGSMKNKETDVRVMESESSNDESLPPSDRELLVEGNPIVLSSDPMLKENVFHPSQTNLPMNVVDHKDNVVEQTFILEHPNSKISRGNEQGL